jgi:hypothetical protein
MRNQITYKNYKLFDGSVIVATSSVDFVSQLRASGIFVCNQGQQEYMEGFAKRLGIYCAVKKLGFHKEIDCRTPDTFVQSLIDNNFLAVEPTLMN